MSGLWVWAGSSYCQMPRQQLQIAFPHHSIPDTLPSLEPHNWIEKNPHPSPRQTWQANTGTKPTQDIENYPFLIVFLLFYKSLKIRRYSSLLCFIYNVSGLQNQSRCFLLAFFFFNITFPPRGTLVQIILVMVSWRGFEKLFLLHLCSSIPSLSSWPKPCLIGGV